MSAFAGLGSIWSETCWVTVQPLGNMGYHNVYFPRNFDLYIKDVSGVINQFLKLGSECIDEIAVVSV